jgi:hypothetical protein
LILLHHLEVVLSATHKIRISYIALSNPSL